MKRMKKYLAVVLAGIVLISAAGCNLIQVDPEKDMKRVVIEMGEEEILKKEFNDYFTYHTLIYEVNGYTLPEGDALKTMKEDLLDTMVEIRVLRKQAEEKKLDVDLESVTEESEEMLGTFLEELGETKYDRILADHSMTQESFKEFFLQYMEDVKYANAAIAQFTKDLQADGKAELEKTIMTLNGETIQKEELYYQLSLLEFEYYLGTGSGLPTDGENLAYIHDEILNRIIENRLMAQLAEELDLSATTQEVEDKVKTTKTNFTTYFSDEAFKNYLAGYYLTPEQFDALAKEEAQRAVLVEKYKKSLETGITVTEDEIKKYYDENKSKYDTDTVSAKHILVESEEYANELMRGITDAASFEAAFAKAKEDDKVKEAADLGAFAFGKMVTEFSAEAFAFSKGQVSKKPVKTEFGYHIIYVYDKHTAVIPTLEEKKDEIRTGLVTSKALTQYTDKLEKEKEDATIKKEEIKEPFEVFKEQLLEQYKVKTYPSRL